MTGPSYEPVPEPLEPLSPRPTPPKSPLFKLNKLPMYIITATTNIIRIMQQIVYPPAVTVSDVKFLIVMVSTITEITHRMMNSYMYERLT